MSRPRKALHRFFSCRTPGTLRRLRDAGEEGFTLIELVVVLVILPLIMGAIAVAIFVTLQDQAGVSTRLSDSVDSQITSAFYVRDVQSAQYVTTTTAPTGTPPWTSPVVCKPASLGVSARFIVSLAWSNPAPTGETVVSYWTTQRATGSGSVTGTTLTSTTPIFNSGDRGQGVVQTIVSAAAIKPGTSIKAVTSSTTATLSKTTTAGPVTFAIGPALVRAFCKGTTSASVTTSRDFFTPFTHAVVSCVPTSSTCPNSGSTWAAAQGVTSVDLSVIEPSGQYDYNVTATPRISNRKGSLYAPPGTTPHPVHHLPTLILIGGAERVIQEDAGSTIKINGTTVLNTGYFKQTGGTFTSPAIWTSLTPVTRICTTHTTHAQCGGKVNGATPPPVLKATHHAFVKDPLAGLADPGSAPVVTPCPSTNGSKTLSPGQYTCQVTVNGAGRTLTLRPGFYEFDHGLSISGGAGSAKLTGSGGVFIYLPCHTAPGETWAPTCAESFSVKNATMTVNPIKTGPYTGLWFWQNVRDTSPVTLTGGSAVYKVSGIMYAPGALLTLKGGSASTNTLGAVDASILHVQNGIFVITGFPT